MEEDKRKKLDALLRQMFAEENPTESKKRPVETEKPRSAKVIRRRKGSPDMHIV